MSVEDLKKYRSVFKQNGLIDLGGVEFEIENEAKWREIIRVLDLLYQKHRGAVGAFFWAWTEVYGSEADETTLQDMEESDFFPGLTLECFKSLPIKESYFRPTSFGVLVRYKKKGVGE